MADRIEASGLTDSSDCMSEEGVVTREGRNSVRKMAHKPKEKKVAPIKSDEGPNSGLNMLFIIVNGLVILFVSSLLYKHFRGNYCDSGIPEAMGDYKCS